MELKLPLELTSEQDLLRLNREIEQLEDHIADLDARHRVGAKSSSRAAISGLLRELMELNGIEYSDAANWKIFRQACQDLERHAPRLQISFAQDPTPAFVTQLMKWLRTNVHAQVLVKIGLQPTIAGGCMVRTPNKVYDFTLRRRLTDKRSMLLEAIRAE